MRPFRLGLIVPIGPEEKNWQAFLTRLPDLPLDWQLVFSLPPRHSDYKKIHSELSVRSGKLVECSSLGRASQINTAIEATDAEYIWVVHADSVVGARHLAAVDAHRVSDQLLYFDLSFEPAKPFWVKLNAFFANLRSRYFGMPFGDQGFLFAKNIWREVGGFDTRPSYGEDHLFVWSCRQRDIRVRRIALKLATSARKYQIKGWLTTSLKHIYLTYKQALPEWKKLLYKQYFKRKR